MFEFSSEFLSELKAKAEPVSDECSFGKLAEFQPDHVICFTPRTLIATPRGARPVETLRVGDLVMTRDHGMQPIRWIQSRKVSGIGQFAPIRLQKGVLTGMEDDLVVSPRHRVLLQGYRAELLFGESEVLVAAENLIDGNMVRRDRQKDVTYIHILFDQHEVIYANGAPTESFHPTDHSLAAVEPQAREELFAIFPELRSLPKSYGKTARRCLQAHEAELVWV
jgi:hypothetical protein